MLVISRDSELGTLCDETTLAVTLALTLTLTLILTLTLTLTLTRHALRRDPGLSRAGKGGGGKGGSGGEGGEGGEGVGLPATWSLLPSAGRVLRRAAARDGWISAPELREIARSGRAVADEVPPWQRKPLESDPNPNPHPNQVPPWHRKPLEWPREEAVDLALALEAAAGFGSLAQAPGYTY